MLENETFENENITSCGREKNKFMSSCQVLNYLGISNKIDKSLKNRIVVEYRKLEEKFKMENIDFALNTDIEESAYPYKIIEKGKILSAFTL